MRRLGFWPLLLAAACGGAGEGPDPAEALRLERGSPRLAELARAYPGDEALLALLTDPVPARRRGAARLAAARGLPAPALLAALSASPDPEVRRLGATGLLGADLPPGAITGLGDPELAAALLSAHPAADPLADPAAGRAIEAWLRDPAAASAATRLVAARGSAARWGAPLVAALESRDEAVVLAAHDCLQILTRSQRNIAMYAGDRRLLAQDWRDALAARPPPELPSPELMALAAELPANEALLALLQRGAAGLAAIERAMAEAPRARRRELEPAARLAAHAVPPGLLQALGAAAFAGLDDPDPAQRLACLRRLAAEVRARADPGGPEMLLAALDDGDPAVRATALDQLVRLSDEKKRFARPWTVADNGLFPPARTIHRLRRSLRGGSGDEQIAALLLIGALEANALLPDALALILSPRDDVVGTALETITRLSPGPEALPPLIRLAEDPAAPVPRRVTAIKTLGEVQQRGSNRGASPAAATLLRLATAGEPALAVPAANALAKGGGDAATLRRILDRLVTLGRPEVALSIASSRSEPEMTALVSARVVAGQADADQAAMALAEALGPGGDSGRRTAAQASAADPALRAALGRAGAGHAVLAHALGQAAMAEALPRILADRSGAGRGLAQIASQADGQEAIAAVAEALRTTPGDHSGAAFHLRRKARALAAQHPDRIATVASRAYELLGAIDTDHEYDDGKQIRVLTLAGGGKLRLEAEMPQGSFDGDNLAWRLVGTPPEAVRSFDPAQLAALVAGLPGDAEERAAAGAVAAWIAGTEPAPALAAAWQREDDVCLLLAEQWPSFRAAVVERIIADFKPQDGSMYALRPWLRLDHRLPALAAQALRADGNPSEWELKPVIAALAEAPPGILAEQMPELLAMPAAAALAEPLLAKAGPLPLPAALALAEGRGIGNLALAAIPAEAAGTLELRLGAWKPAEVLARAGAVRRLRSAGQAAVDAALAALVARADVTAAAWLRSGLPAEAGMAEAYRAAAASPVPELALVGAAAALKDGALAFPAFLAAVAAWPSAVQVDAAAAARRFGSGRWGDPGVPEAAAGLAARLGARALAAWIAVLPADPAVVEALAARVADPATAEAIGGALAARAAREPAWKPAAAAIAARAGGRLDWLAPKP